MWVTKLLISPVKKRIFCPKTTKFGPKLAFLVNLARPCRLIQCPVGGSVGGCGARAVSRKTPIYFILYLDEYVYCKCSIGLCRPGFGEVTALHIAVLRGHLPLVSLLTSAGGHLVLVLLLFLAI